MKLSKKLFENLNLIFSIQLDNMKLEDHLKIVIEAHRDYSVERSRSVRKWDKKTPYWIHPVWCATTILFETLLPENLREDGYLALLYHDILEETTIKLPNDLPERVKHFVQQMSFENGSMQEMQEIWSKRPEIKLFKLYDKVSNLMDGMWMDSERKQRHCEYVKRLTDEVESVYGGLNIVKIARAVTK